MSMPGIIELTAVEYYANESEDADGLVGSLIVTPSEPEEKGAIEGENFIRPKKSYIYTYVGEQEGSWTVESKSQVDYVVNGKEITISWPKTYGGTIVLSYANESREITVESLF
jgi:hypothetical protein